MYSDFMTSDLEMAWVGGLSRTTEEEEEEGGEEEEVGGNMGVKRMEGGSHVVGSDGMTEMRVVTKDMKSMTYDLLSSYRGPTDLVNLLGGSGGTGGEDSGPSFEEFMKQCVRGWKSVPRSSLFSRLHRHRIMSTTYCR